MPGHIANKKIINRFKVSNRKFLIYKSCLLFFSKNNLFRVAKKKKVSKNISSQTN